MMIFIFFIRLKTGWSSRSSSASNTKENRAKGNNAMTMMMGNNINTSGNYINTNNSRNFMQQQASNALADSQSPKNSFNYQPQISDAEFYEIEQVLKRASAIEQKEYDRIGRLYQRYNMMNKPQGNGETSCFICNSNFGILGASPRICNDCLKVRKFTEPVPKFLIFLNILFNFYRMFAPHVRSTHFR